jgi:hypothetical protein
MATYTPLKDKTGKITAHRFQIRKRGYKEKTKQFTTKGKGERWAKKTESEMDAGSYESTSNAGRWPSTSTKYTLSNLSVNPRRMHCFV